MAKTFCQLTSCVCMRVSEWVSLVGWHAKWKESTSVKASKSESKKQKVEKQNDKEKKRTENRHDTQTCYISYAINAVHALLICYSLTHAKT